MKPVHFGDPAAEELAAAIRLYERRLVGLGAELFDAVPPRLNSSSCTRKSVQSAGHVRAAGKSTFIDFRNTKLDYFSVISQMSPCCVARVK